MAKVTSSSFPDLFDARFRTAVLSLTTLARPSNLVFSTFNSDRSYEKFTETAMGGYLSEKAKGASAFEGTIHQGSDKLMTPVTYSMGYRFEFEAFADDMTASFQRAPESLAGSGMNTQELTRQTVIDNGIAGTDTGPDGKSLLNTAHPKLDGGTYANKPSTDIDLSPSAVRDGLAAFEKLPDHFGIVQGNMPVILGTATEEHLYAKELMQSAGLPDGALNNINPWMNALTPVSFPLQTDTDAWVMWGAPAENGMITVLREQVNLGPWEQEQSTRDLTVFVFGRWADGYVAHAPMHCYGSKGG